MPQQTLPCSVYRGGFCRGLFFHKSDLPSDPQQARHIYLSGLDAYNLSQADGLGGTTPATSKAAVMAPSTRDDADAEYCAIQIGIGEPVVDCEGTCGNLMSAAGLFCVDEGLVRVPPGAAEVAVRMYDVNIKKIIVVHVPVQAGKAATGGDYRMPGVAQKSAKLLVSIIHPGGGTSGSTLPLGLNHTVTTPDGPVEVTVADIVNPLVCVRAADLGIAGDASRAVLAGDEALMRRMLTLRDVVAVELGMAASVATAYDESPAVPRLAVLFPPRDYTANDGTMIPAEDMDIAAMVTSLGKLHLTAPISALDCIAAVSLMRGSVANRLVRPLPAEDNAATVRVAHPGGVVEVRAALTDDGSDVFSVGTYLSARRIMKGELYIPDINAVS